MSNGRVNVKSPGISRFLSEHWLGLLLALPVLINHCCPIFPALTLRLYVIDLYQIDLNERYKPIICFYPRHDVHYAALLIMVPTSSNWTILQ